MKKHLSLFLFLFVFIFWSCEKEDENPDPNNGSTYQKLTSSTTKIETAGCYSSDKIYYKSNISSASSDTYDIWRIDNDGSNAQEILDFTSTGWGARTGGAFSIYQNRLSFYEAEGIHKCLSLDLSETFPVSRVGNSGPSTGINVLLTIPAGLGGAYVNYHTGTAKGAWIVRTSGNGVTPTAFELRIADATAITGGSATTVGTKLIDGFRVGETFSFSPDGSQIVISHAPTGSASNIANDIYIINASTGAIVKRLTTEGDNGIPSNNPSWSPNGNLIAFDREDSNGNHQVYTIKADGTGLTQRTKKDASITGETGPFSWGYPIWIDSDELIIHRYHSAYRQIWRLKF